jgi:hypothetical protein
MSKFRFRIAPIAALLLAPLTVFAHPGHFDDAPFAHALSHGIVYAVGIIGAGLAISQSYDRLLRAISNRRRRN